MVSAKCYAVTLYDASFNFNISYEIIRGKRKMKVKIFSRAWDIVSRNVILSARARDKITIIIIYFSFLFISFIYLFVTLYFCTRFFFFRNDTPRFDSLIFEKKNKKERKFAFAIKRLEGY